MNENINDIRLMDDGTIDIEASVEGKKPRIKTFPAYSGGKLDIAWTFNGERLPVVVDLQTLEASNGIPFVLNHNINQPLGTIESITKTQSDLQAEGSFTHGHTLYGGSELTAAKNGFKHRPSVTVYNPDPKNVVRIGEGERKYINGRYQEGAFFAVYHGKLRNIALVSTPGDSDSDKSGSILAQAQGVNTMSMELFPDGKEAPEQNAPATETTASPPAQNIEAQAQPAAPAPAVQTLQPKPNADHPKMISDMYNRGDISVDIMAQAIDQNWSPVEALRAQDKINFVKIGVGGAPNVAGFPNAPTKKNDEPHGDMIMASAFLMSHCGFKPSDFDKNNKDAVLRLDDRTIDAATSGDLRGIRFSDICAHAAESFYEGKTSTRRKLYSKKPMEYFAACVQAQPNIDAKLDFDTADDIRADADTGLSTIGLRNIWALINTATIGKAYQEVPTVWQRICKQASVSNFLKHTVHRVEMVGDYQRLSRIGGEPPHATYMESQTEAKIDTWGLMLALSRQDIINDEVGVFTDAAAQLGRKAAKTLEKECFAALLTDGSQLFTTSHKNKLNGANSAFGFDSLDKAFTAFRKQKTPGGEPIMVRPSFLLVPTSLSLSAKRLLSMGTIDGTPLGASTGYQNFPIVESEFLIADNGLYVVEGSKKIPVPGSDTGWYLFANPNDILTPPLR